MHPTCLPTWRRLAEFTLAEGPTWIFWVRADGTFAYVSPAMLRVLGYSSAEVEHLRVTDILLNYEEVDRSKLRKRIDSSSGRHAVRASLRKKGGGVLSVESENNSLRVGEETFNVAFCRKLFDADDPVSNPLRQPADERRATGGARLYEVCDDLGIVGTSKSLIEALSRAYHYAANRRPILIRGETGVGKESLAQLVHRLSPLADRPFLTVNCGTITEQLAISNLFGHVKGAYTGAAADHDGIFHRADGGTVFLDEVGELPTGVQAMLLRVLQTGEYRKLGGTETLRTEVRVIAATNRNLNDMVAKGTFRQDLLHRLDFLRVTLPPLRHRAGDLPMLVRHRLRYLNQAEGLARAMPSPSDMALLAAYSFPGNIRELFGLLERAYFDGGNGPLEISEELLELSLNTPSLPDDPLLTFQENEQRHIVRVLRACGGKIGGKGGAAEVLDLPRTTLISKMRRLGLEDENGR